MPDEQLDVLYRVSAVSALGEGTLSTEVSATPRVVNALRDIGPAGVWIFYDKGYYSDALCCLEAAQSDQSTGVEWGCYGTTITGADGTAIGTGYQNTLDIEAGCTTGGTAADLAANLVLEGYNDWFLPSLDELNAMYTNLKAYGVGGFAPNYYVYWNSSEDNANYAWTQYFTDGSQSANFKSLTRYVRAVRAF